MRKSSSRSRSEYANDREFKAVHNKCDICDDRIMCSDDIETQIDKLDEIDNSFESDLDNSTYEQGPKLILCDYCQKEYLIPSLLGQ